MAPIPTDSFSPVTIETSPELAPAWPPAIPDRIRTMSDDECLRRLAQAVRRAEPDHLDEIAGLLGRLAVTIE